MTERAPLVEIAAQIDRAEAEQLARTGPPGADGVLEVGGGRAVLKGERSPFNVALGLGLAGPVSAEAIEAVEAHLGRGGGAVRIELSAPAHPSLAAELARRGYRLERFHQVWMRAPARAAGEGAPGALARASAGGLVIRPIVAGEERAWGEAFALAFFGRLPPSEEVVEALLAMPRAPGNVCFGAFEGERVLGVAIASAHAAVATLSGAGVVAPHRGAGLQVALIEARLAWAAAEGCTLAASAAEPGTASQRNLERAGFRCAYPRAVMVRD